MEPLRPLNYAGPSPRAVGGRGLAVITLGLAVMAVWLAGVGWAYRVLQASRSFYLDGPTVQVLTGLGGAEAICAFAMGVIVVSGRGQWRALGWAALGVSAVALGIVVKAWVW